MSSVTSVVKNSDSAFRVFRGQSAVRNECRLAEMSGPRFAVFSLNAPQTLGFDPFFPAESA